jgi:hypothetical protein
MRTVWTAGLLFLAPALAVPAWAQTGPQQTAHVGATYAMGDNDTRAQAREICLAKAERKALEASGALVESELDMISTENKAGVSDQAHQHVRSYVGAVVNATNVQESFRLEGERMLVDCTATVAFNPDEVRDHLRMAHADNTTKVKVDEQQVRIAALETEVNGLKAQLAQRGGVLPSLSVEPMPARPLATAPAPQALDKAAPLALNTPTPQLFDQRTGVPMDSLEPPDHLLHHPTQPVATNEPPNPMAAPRPPVEAEALGKPGAASHVAANASPEVAPGKAPGPHPLTPAQLAASPAVAPPHPAPWPKAAGGESEQADQADQPADPPQQMAQAAEPEVDVIPPQLHLLAPRPAPQSAPLLAPQPVAARGGSIRPGMSEIDLVNVIGDPAASIHEYARVYSWNYGRLWITMNAGVVQCISLQENPNCRLARPFPMASR